MSFCKNRAHFSVTYVQNYALVESIIVKRSMKAYNSSIYIVHLAHHTGRGVMHLTRGELVMEVSYNRLWKLLIDKNMKKKDLRAKTGISWTSITKMTKNEPVSMSILSKICNLLEVNIGEIMDFIPKKQ